ncbi:MAG: hypothetical protein JJ938_09605 [Roseicyclus sp.]|nr:hypothetical protein [Roseicyclus sp.]
MFGLGKKRRADIPHPDFPAMTDVSYLRVLSEIEARRNVERYLEIGSRSGDSVSRVTCSFMAVDPEFAIRADVFNKSEAMMFFQQTSDDFFASGVLGRLGWVPDLTFVDGMHLFEYALRDFMNAEKAMGRDGMICLHDICPFDYEMTTRDLSRFDQLTAWTGDVWKVVMALLDLRPDLTVDIVAARRTGLACISNLDPENRVLEREYDALLKRYKDLELAELGGGAYYDRFELIDPERFIANL